MSNTIKVTVGLTVVIILVGAVLVPAIGSGSDESPVDVFIVAGQSNTYASIAIDAAAASPVTAEGTAYYFGTDTAPTYTSSIDLSTCTMQDMSDNGVAKIGGIYSAFAYKYHEMTGRTAYLIDTGLSGQTVYSFLPGHSNWQHVYNVIEAGMAAIPDTMTPHVRGFIWIQGEGDAGTTITTYESRMIELRDAYSNGSLPIMTDNCFIAKVRETVSANASTAQTYLANNVDGFYMASDISDTFTTANGMMYTDDLHYSQTGCNALGTSLGEFIGDFCKDRSPDYSGLLSIIPLIIIAAVVISLGSMIITKRE